jgi:hypothetical protein
MCIPKKLFKVQSSVQGRKMKTKMLAVSLWRVIIACPVAARTAKLQVAYPTTIGSIAGMTKEAKLFERQGLESI